MGLCSGALRRYLEERKELPADPLIAMVPVSVRTEEQQGTFGNQVSAMSASLHTHIADPVQRLESIHESMSIATEQPWNRTWSKLPVSWCRKASLPLNFAPLTR
jgi:hypothetical protein